MTRIKYNYPGIYNATPLVLSDGEGCGLAVNSSGQTVVDMGTAIYGEDSTLGLLAVMQKPVASSTYSPSIDNQMTQVTKRNSKASLGNVLSSFVSNTNAAVRYFQIHNKASTPAGGDVPVISMPIPAGSATVPGVLLLLNNFYTPAGYHLSTGVSWAISTTYATFTDSATASEHIVVINYK